MDVEQAIVTLLKADATINGVVGGRISATGLPESLARPNVVYQRIGTGRMWSNDGPAGLARATLQVSCYANDYPTAKAMAASIRAALDGFSGTVGGLEIQACFLDDERDAPVPPSPGRSHGIAGVVLVFIIAHSE